MFSFNPLAAIVAIIVVAGIFAFFIRKELN